MEIGHGNLSTAILSIPLVQVGQLSVTGEVLINRLDLSLPRKRAVRLTDRLDITIIVDWDVKSQINHPTQIIPPRR